MRSVARCGRDYRLIGVKSFGAVFFRSGGDGGGRGAPAPVLVLREDRSRPHAGHPRRHPHDSAVSIEAVAGRGAERSSRSAISHDSRIIAARHRGSPARARRPVIRGQGGHDPYAVPHAHDVPDADPAGRTTDCGVLHIGGRLPRGPTPGFPHDSAVLTGTSISSARAPMCRQGLSAHGRISTALNAGEFPHDSADPPPTGSDRMCSTAPTGPMPHIRTRQHRPDTAETTGAAPGCAKRAAAPPRPPPSPPGQKNTTPGDSTVCYAPSPFTVREKGA